MTNKKKGTLYVGVTSDIKKRIFQHKSGVVEGFTKKYNLKILVYYEIHPTILLAIEREKQLKGGNRLSKLELIQSMNKHWYDLYDDILD